MPETQENDRASLIKMAALTIEAGQCVVIFKLPQGSKREKNIDENVPYRLHSMTRAARGMCTTARPATQTIFPSCAPSIAKPSSRKSGYLVADSGVKYGGNLIVNCDKALVNLRRFGI
jgi:hypothetical protein